MTNRRMLAVCLAITLTLGVIVVALWNWDVNDEASGPDRPPNGTLTARNASSNSIKSVRPSDAIDPSVVDFIGSSSCRDCHQEIWEKYQSHPMATSCTRVDIASPIEDYTRKTEISPPGDRRYRVEHSDGGVRHHEIMVDRAGDVIYDQSVPVDYTIGSGKRGRAFVINRDGLLFKSSISWYSDRHDWGLSPDYLPEQHQRFERRVTGGCLTCHSGLPNFIREEADHFGAPPLLEAAIGCERCHGPGRKHVAAQESGGIGDDPIVNPGKLDVERREAVCAQCHLHGESRILRTGRTPHDFRPGERLDANWVIFVKSHGTGVTRSGRAASQVEHMVSSVCFQRSQGRMGCTSCHDPHSIPDASNKDNYFRERCLQCHTEHGCSLALTQREVAPHFDNCTKCHMPSIPSDNILHRSIADHRILRRPGIENEEGTGDSKVFQFAENAIPEFELIRARALKMIDNAFGPPIRPELAREANQLLMSLIAESPDDPELFVALGNGCQIQNQLREATRWRLRVLQLNPRHEKTVQVLAETFHDQFQVVPAERYLKQFIELNPWHGSYHGRLAGTQLYRGDTAAAIASAERALELNPRIFVMHELLIKAYEKTGDLESAARHQKLLARIHETINGSK